MQKYRKSIITIFIYMRLILLYDQKIISVKKECFNKIN